MRRFIFVTHRYLGIGVGLIMAMWCLSGFVMIYVPYPAISSDQVLQGSRPLDLKGCCDSSQIDSLGLVDVHGFTVEMLGEGPVVRLEGSGGRSPVLDLRSGTVLEDIPPERAREAALAFKTASGIGGSLSGPEEVVQDQWTVSAFFDPHRPLYKFAATDPDRSEWYLSSSTGEVLQFTNGPQRFWNWLGAVPHWLYPTVLRQHDDLWAQVMTWLSLAGVFLTALGIYIGIRQYRTYRSGRKSPYRGVGLWHHYAGLLFGVFILTWVASGFFSMNPWGMFDLGGGGAVRQRLEGVPLFSSEVADFLRQLPQRSLPGDTVRVEGRPLGGKLFYVAYQANGSRTRFDGRTFQPAPLGEEDWEKVTAAAVGSAQFHSATLLQEEDAYYYDGHDSEGRLPVYRLILASGDRIYLDPVSANLVDYFDRPERLYRWLFSGLHSLDFPGPTRSRPLWDVIVWLLMVGVTVGTLTGAYMGVKRLLR